MTTEQPPIVERLLIAADDFDETVQMIIKMANDKGVTEAIAGRPLAPHQVRAEHSPAIREAAELIDELVEGLEFYANPEIYKPHPHGLAFDRRDLSFKARALLAKVKPSKEEPHAVNCPARLDRNDDCLCGYTATGVPQ
jgi:hypothetical protein